ncbi:MAG: serine/threonine protein kinase [Polyangiaceae bacterium]|nr:serine/threonine protein kinase [Polyangiaceae bacterium]
MRKWAARALEGIKLYAYPALRLTPDERRRLEDERVEGNRGRTAGVLPVLVIVQVAMLFVFWPVAGDPHPAFRAGVFWIHLLTLPLSAAWLITARVATARNLRVAWLGDAVVIHAVLLGLLLSLNTHRLLPNINSLTVALFAGALVVRPTFAGSLVAYAGTAAGLIAGVNALQPDPQVRVSTMSVGVTAVAITFVLSRVLAASFVRDVEQRSTIARQQAELVRWNAELERRVDAQVIETLAHAREAQALDAQLRLRVRERSRELARAVRSVAQEETRLGEGALFEHRFEIDATIGAGAMGDVYRARGRASGQTVALKVLRRWDGIAAVDMERFVVEAAAAATVVHPAIVRTYHVDVAESGQFYLVMELVEGRTLASELLRGRYDAGQTARLGATVADALHAAHAAGVVHRDVKPGNLMVTSRAPGVRVLDFGISKLADTDVTGKTVAEKMVGTPEYMAPEQIVGGGEVTGACDIYALGQVLYEMLTGEPCFQGKTVGDVLRAHVNEAPMSVRSRSADGVPEDLAGLIRICLEKNPAQRPSAETLAASLRVIADALGAPKLEDIGPPRFIRILVQSPEVGAPTLRAEAET